MEDFGDKTKLFTQLRVSQLLVDCYEQSWLHFGIGVVQFTHPKVLSP